MNKFIFVAALLFSQASVAQIFPTKTSDGGLGTASCTGSVNCTQESWGIDLNHGAGYKWTVNQLNDGSANLYFKLASSADTRKMSYWVNGTQVSVISIAATAAPRPTGKEFGPFAVPLKSGTNIIELRDTENTDEFDVHYLRVLNSVGRDISKNLEVESNDGSSGIIFEVTNDSAGNQNATMIDANDFVEWQVNIPTTGSYKLTTRSSTVGSPRLEILSDNNFTAEIGLSSTGGLNQWRNFESSVFGLTAGVRKLRVRFATGEQKINWVRLENTASQNPIEEFSTGLWRIVSRDDRRTLTSADGASMSFIDYAATSFQHWRLTEFSPGSFEFQHESSGQCLIPQGAIAILGACGIDANNWKIEILRARTEERPAIYRLRSGQNNCLIPNGTGSPRLGACDQLSRWYLEAVGFGERRGRAVEYEVRSLLIVKPTTSATNGVSGTVFARGTIPQDIVTAAQVSHNERVNLWFDRMTDGRVRFVGQSVVGQEPIRTLTEGGGNWLPAATNLPNDVQRFVPRGIFDTVQIFFTGGNQPGGWGWGPGRSAASNHTLWTTTNGGVTPADQWLSTTDSEPTEVLIHEPMHGFDSHFDALGLPLPEGFLHGAGDNRYATYLNQRGWVHWYRDYWLGTVIASDDTYRGYGPRMFRMQTIRAFAAAQPESGVKITHASSGRCLSSQDVSVNNSLIFSDRCDTAASTFVLQENGMLRHLQTGMCIHPNGGTARNDVALILFNACAPEARLTHRITDGGSIQQTQTGLCVHPQGGSSQPANGTLAIYHSGCDEERLRFRFVR